MGKAASGMARVAGLAAPVLPQQWWRRQADNTPSYRAEPAGAAGAVAIHRSVAGRGALIDILV